MHNRTRRNLSLGILCACAAGVAFDASRTLAEGDDQALSITVPRHAPRANLLTAPSANPTAAVPLAAADAEDDPFAPRGWGVLLPVVATPAPVVAPILVAAPAATPAPIAPALPFAFMGRMGDGPSELVYISRGEESWTVKGGEILDANYKVVAVTPQQIVFEHVPTGTQQTLALPEPDK